MNEFEKRMNALRIQFRNERVQISRTAEARGDTSITIAFGENKQATISFG